MSYPRTGLQLTWKQCRPAGRMRLVKRWTLARQLANPDRSAFVLPAYAGGLDSLLGLLTGTRRTGT
jgi:hypothetical protein